MLVDDTTPEADPSFQLLAAAGIGGVSNGSGNVTVRLLGVFMFAMGVLVDFHWFNCSFIYSICASFICSLWLIVSPTFTFLDMCSL